MSMDLLLSVLLPPHDQSRVSTGRHQVLVEQLVLGNYKKQKQLVCVMMIRTITIVFITNNKEIMAYKR